MKVKCHDCSASTVNGRPVHEAGCLGVFTFTDENGLKFKKFRVFSLDVWGNTRHGFEVNDRSEIGSIFIGDDWNEKEVIQEMKRAGMMSERSRIILEWSDGGGEDFYLDHRSTGAPVFQFEAQ